MNENDSIEKPLVFLDMDGVLNNDDFIEQWTKEHGWDDESKELFIKRYYMHDGHEGYIVPELRDRLLSLCEKTGCKIVWSSSWREKCWKKNQDTGEYGFDWNETRNIWKAKKLPVQLLVGCTPCLDLSRFSYVPRGVEIQEWIDGNADRRHVGKMAILDDNPDAEVGVTDSRARFFRTDSRHGLTEKIADEIAMWFDISSI